MARKSGFDGVLSVGRVQTPILGLIVARDKEFETFKSIDYYSLLGEFKINNKTIKARLKTDEKIKKLLMEKDKKGESGGIGTPATKSNHIKTLIDRAYIEVSKDKKQV